MSLAPRYRVPLCLVAAALAGFALFNAFGVSVSGEADEAGEERIHLATEEEQLPTLRSRHRFESMDVEAGTRTLHGTVIDADGAPLAGIKVVLIPEHDEPWHETDPLSGGGELFGAPVMRLPPIDNTVSGPDGGFRFDSLRSNQNYNAIPVVAPPLYGAGRWVWIGHRKPPHVTLRILSGTRDVKVRVVDAAGNGIESYVRFYCREGRKQDPTRAWWTAPYAKTDADGRLALRGAPAREFWARVWAPGIGARSGLDIPKDAKGEIELRLGDDGGPVVEGRVMDAQGRPIAKARVWGSTSDGSLDISHGVSATVTDSEGRYRLGPMSTGQDLRVNAIAPGHMLGVVIWPGMGARGTGPHHVDLMLPPGGSIRGRVTDDAGHPIANAQVRVFAMSGKVTQYRGDAPRTRSDQNGYYHLQGVALGPCNISAYSEGRYLPLSAHPDRDAHSTWYSGIPITLTRAGATVTQDLQLRQGVPVTGKAVDGTGHPIVGAEIKFSCSSSTSESITDVDSAGLVIHTNADGEFVHPGLPPAKWRVRAFADGRGAESPYFDVAVDTPPKDVTLELREMPSVSGRLLGIAEDALKTLRVVLVNKEHGDESMGVAPDGRFAFEGLWPELYTLEVRGALSLALHAPTPLQLAWGERVDDLELQLVGLGTITVRVTTRDGRPAVDHEINVTAGFLLGAGAELNRRGPNESVSEDRETNDEGLLIVHALPLGRYTVADGSNSANNRAVWPGEGEVALVVEDVDAPEDAIWLSTRVVDSRGVPVPWAAVKFDSGSDDTDPDGIPLPDPFSDGDVDTYVRSGRLHMALPADTTEGTLSITTARDAGGLRLDLQPVQVRVSVKAPPAQIVMPDGLHLRGRALDPAGEPLPDVRVALHPGADTPSALAEQIEELGWVQTDAAGRFEVPALSPGSLTLALTGTKGHLANRIENVSVGRSDVELRLLPGTTITGTVLTPDGRPASDVRLSFNANRHTLDNPESDERTSWNASSDENGEFKIEYLPLRATGTLVAEPSTSPEEPWLDTEVDNVAAGSGDVVVKLKRGVMGYAQVRLPDGKLATEFEVSVEPVRGNYWIRVDATPSKGKFRFGPVAPGEYVVDLQPAYPEVEESKDDEPPPYDLVGITRTVTLPSGAPMTFTLGRNTPLRGRLHAPGSGSWNVQVVKTDGTPRSWRPVALDAKAWFTIDTDGTEDLAVYFWSPDDRRMALLKSPRAGGPPYRVQLTRGHVLSGVIRNFPLDADGATIHLSGPHGIGRSTPVDESGSFECHGLPDGKYDVVLECRQGYVRRTRGVAPTAGLVLEFVKHGE